jgi:cyanophycinase
MRCACLVRSRVVASRLLVGILVALGTARAGEAVPDTAARPETAPARDTADESDAPGGALVICGGGVLPDELPQKFLELAGGREARVVVVTTASRYADSPNIERVLAFWRRQPLAALDVLHTRSRETADTPEFSEPLVTATGVWFVGGNQNKIVDAYLDTRTEERLHDVLRRGGVIGGTSAGSAIMSRVMIRGGRTEPVIGHGLGFLSGAIIDQHFLKRRRQPRLVEAVRAHPDHVGLGIDEGTAVVVRGTSLRVLGESEVCAYLPPEAPEQRPVLRTLKAGDVIALDALGAVRWDDSRTVASGSQGE